MGNAELVNGFQAWLYTSITSGSFTNTNAEASRQTDELTLLESRTHASVYYFKAPQVILMAELETIKLEHRTCAIKEGVENKDRKGSQGQPVEGPECHTKEPELYLQGSKDLSRTIPRKTMISTRQEAKPLKCIWALCPLLVPDYM